MNEKAQSSQLIQNPTLFYDKTLSISKLGIEKNFLSLIKDTYTHPTLHFTFNGERLKSFLLQSGTRKVCQLSPLSFNMKFLASAIR